MAHQFSQPCQRMVRSAAKYVTCCLTIAGRTFSEHHMGGAFLCECASAREPSSCFMTLTAYDGTQPVHGIFFNLRPVILDEEHFT